MQTIKLSAVDRKQGAAWSWTCLLLELKTKKKKMKYKKLEPTIGEANKRIN